MAGYMITGFLAGTISGMGIGGGALLIPALAILYGMSQQAAQSVNLLYFIPTAAIAIITHRKKKNIETKGLLRLTLFGMIGAGIGSSLALWTNPIILKKIFGFFLLIMGVIEIFKRDKQQERKMKMELTAFEKMKKQFTEADVDTKINMYIEAEGLSQTQYKELLRLFPLNELSKLEEALA